MNKRILISILVLGATLIAIGCNVVSASVTKPTTVIVSPPSNSQFHAGETVAIQSTSTDLAGIARVELLVDDVVVRSDPSPQAQTTFSVIQTWTASPGTHTIMVRAVNGANGVSAPAAIDVFVLVAQTTPTPLVTATAAPRACLSSAFVADVTLPDGTLIAAGQTFNKIWRVRNTGTCAWGAGTDLVFTGGEAMTTTTAIPVPSTAAGATADLLIALSAPGTPGTHAAAWRLKNATSGLFGATLDVAINVVGTPPPNCPFTPVIESFSANPTTITAGQSATLSWGLVKGAEKAEIDNDIGGVATPGSVTVNPGSTTTYTLTATCGSKVSRTQVTITVLVPSMPTFTPIPTPTKTPTP